MDIGHMSLELREEVRIKIGVWEPLVYKGSVATPPKSRTSQCLRKEGIVSCVKYFWEFELNEN